ncbi:MAG: hypothetical protein ACR2OI_07190 [Acidimicrobiia bacterium]
MRRTIALIALALVAAACGSGESSAAFEPQEAGTPTTEASPTSAAPSSTPTTTTPDESPTETSQPTTTTAPPAAPTEVPDSDYPDLVVADLAGGEVNLRELVLEPRPVLLWFWAPH